jgi:hypothetical protein
MSDRVANPGDILEGSVGVKAKTIFGTAWAEKCFKSSFIQYVNMVTRPAVSVLTKMIIPWSSS